jgi:hypothetical protein
LFVSPASVFIDLIHPDATAMHARSWLILAQTAGIQVAAIVAAYEIESIVFSGPILSVTGALIALLSFRRGCTFGLLFGLAAPSVTAFCLFVIAMLEWSPGDAHLPVSTFLFLFGLGCIPACAVTILEARAVNAGRANTPFQYSIAAMLVLMLALALGLGLTQAYSYKGAAAGTTLAYLVVLLYVLHRHFENRRSAEAATGSPFQEPEHSPSTLQTDPGERDP